MGAGEKAKAEGYKRRSFETSKRVCLKCSKEFKSVSAANRLCTTCNSDNVKVARTWGTALGIETSHRRGVEVR